ncbi:hypothetical protein HOLleu_16129 [Holothuria leucospilota]|uniref:Uncharacterized protein n=1 Tax=Holothuria leucospilota TaxID=206669 RepID=A0A9Q1C5N8_HOLLE|nr:hypothetical protein HOLleu_16129 [Holothuria leucospilota]
MRNLAVICFFVVGAVVLLAQGISSDDGSWYEEVLDVEKRQSWSEFRRKHIVEDSEFAACRGDWDCIGRLRFGAHPSRTFSTFIRTKNRLDVIYSFDREPKEYCRGGPYRKSKDDFELVELRWIPADNKYKGSIIGPWFICVALDGAGRPIHFDGKVR